MTDRISAFVVILEEDTRVDDAEHTLNAIRLIRGVLRVEPHVTNLGEHIAETRVRERLGKDLMKVIHPD